MDFIERWFGLSPDGGDGSLEMLYLVAVVVIVGGFLLRKQLRSWWSRNQRLTTRD